MMSKVKSIFKVDASMIPVFTLLIVTGIGIHIASENGNRHSWGIWSVFHVVCAVAFLILGYFHVKQHAGWFRTLLKGNVKGRGVTMALTILMLAEIISGAILLAFVDGEGSFWGHFHWIAGILLAVIGTRISVKRFNRRKKDVLSRQVISWFPE